MGKIEAAHMVEKHLLPYKPFRTWIAISSNSYYGNLRRHGC